MLSHIIKNIHLWQKKGLDQKFSMLVCKASRLEHGEGSPAGPLRERETIQPLPKRVDISENNKTVMIITHSDAEYAYFFITHHYFHISITKYNLRWLQVR